MATVKMSGMASGLPPNLVDQLVQVERLPIKTVEGNKAKMENRMKLVGELESYLREIGGTLGDLANSKGFTALTVKSGDPSIIEGVVEPGSGAKGSWNIEVMRLASKAGAISNTFPDKNETQVGVGYLSFETSEGTKEVYIDSNNSTLEGVARAINNSGLGVSSSVLQERVDGESVYRLLITGTGYGDDKYVEFPTLYFLDGDHDFFFEKKNEPENAKVKIDGFEFEFTENKIDNLAPGLSIDLRQAAPGKNVNISVKEDQEVVVGKIDTFVGAINDVLSFIQNQNKLTADTDTSNNLGGDSLLRSIETDLRRIIQDPVSGVGTINRISQLGIRFTRDGVLEFNREAFQKALVSNTDATRNFLVGDGVNTGFVPKIQRKITTYFDGSWGLITNRKNNYQRQLRQMDDRIESMERRVQAKEQTLRRQFGNLEEKMSKLKSQGQFLAQRLGGGPAQDINFGGASVG